MEKIELSAVTTAEKIPSVTSDSRFINILLETLSVVLSILIVASYFFVLKIDGEIKFTSFAVNMVLLALSTVAVGFLSKQIAINHARETQKYKEVLSRAIIAVRAVKDLKIAEVKKYCLSVAKSICEEQKRYIVEAVGIDFETYKTRYETTERTKFGDLSKAQNKAVRKANKTRLKRYNSDFITMIKNDTTAKIQVPSTQFNYIAKNRANNIKAILTTALTSCFVASIVPDITGGFSKKIVLAAILKVITLTFSAGSKFIFGWRLVTTTETANLELKTTEAENCIKFCAENENGADQISAHS